MLDDLAMDDLQRTQFKAYRFSDPARNLRERYAFFQQYNPDYAAERFAFLPQVIAHGWAVWSSPTVDFAYTIGVFHGRGKPDVLLVAPSLDMQARARLLNALVRRMIDGETIGAGDSIAVDDGDAAARLTFHAYRQDDFAAYPAGMLYSFARFFQDEDYDAQPQLLLAHLEPPKRKGLLGRLLGRS